MFRSDAAVDVIPFRFSDSGMITGRVVTSIYVEQVAHHTHDSCEINSTLYLLIYLVVFLSYININVFIIEISSYK